MSRSAKKRLNREARKVAEKAENQTPKAKGPGIWDRIREAVVLNEEEANMAPSGLNKAIQACLDGQASVKSATNADGSPKPQGVVPELVRFGLRAGAVIGEYACRVARQVCVRNVQAWKLGVRAWNFLTRKGEEAVSAAKKAVEIPDAQVLPFSA